MLACLWKWKEFIPSPKGQILAQAVIMLPLLLVFSGLVIDGGLMYVHYRKAEIVALTAAQAAGHAIDAEHFLNTQEIRLDTAQAFAYAGTYAAKNSGGNLHVAGMTIAPHRIEVTVEGRADMLFMRMFGIETMPVRATATAYPGYGISAEGE